MPKRLVMSDSAGRINYVATLSDDTAALPVYASGVEVPLDWVGSTDTYYVSNGECLIRPINPATIEGYTLSNLPTPCVISIDNVSYDCNESTAEMSFDHAGVYKVKVTSFPHLDAEFELTV